MPVRVVLKGGLRVSMTSSQFRYPSILSRAGGIGLRNDPETFSSIKRHNIASEASLYSEHPHTVIQVQVNGHVRVEVLILISYLSGLMPLFMA